MWVGQRSGKNASQIRAELLNDHPTIEVPSRKTIERRIREWSANRGTDWWTLSKTSVGENPADADEAALVLPVIGALSFLTNGNVTHITEAEARWIARIRRARPDLLRATDVDSVVKDTYTSVLLVFLLAVEYSERERAQLSTEDLDLFLAWAPWENNPGVEEWKRKRYLKLVEEGEMPGELPSRFIRAGGNLGSEWFARLESDRGEGEV
jgi:hypothetical protein